MTFDFFEGPAGTGKTHNLVRRANELVTAGVLGNGQKLLALTFMNGARQRLEARLGREPAFRRRFACQTFDVFARTLAARRRSLLTPGLREQANALGQFDGPCFLAASVLENPSARHWVARSFPMVVVDEAQDLDHHRWDILKRLSESCSVVAAADAFQCLTDGRDTAPLVAWLEGAGQTHRLAQSWRTNQQGLLAAARSIREASDVKSVLTPTPYQGRTTWRGAGLRLFEVPATKKNPGLLAWHLANEIARRSGLFAILTPDSTNPIVQNALSIVQTKRWTRKNGAVFGAYPVTWDRQDTEEADALLAGIMLPEHASFETLRVILTAAAHHAPIAHTISRMDRLRRVQGRMRFTAAEVIESVRDSVRNQSRFGFRQPRGHLAMTIQRAKNREFPNVIVIWPHSVTGSPEHLRRLLYNGMTRAMNHCSVIVLGGGRLDAPPFAPAGS